MFFRRTSSHVNQQQTIYLTIQASSRSLITRKDKAPVFPDQGRCRVSPFINSISRLFLTVAATVVLKLCHRKESVLSPIRRRAAGRTSFFASFSAASLTVEAALELPIFFVLTAIILQYASVMRTAAQYSGSLATTAQEMAIAAYKEQYSDANHIIRAALSDAWATSQVISTAPDKGAVRNASFLNSSYMKEDNLIRLVLSYQPRPVYSLVSLPFTFFVQQAAVRGWVGKDGHSGSDKNQGEEEKEPSHTVYVTEHGSVYHTNPGCSHLKVTIIPVTRKQLKSARNTSGGKYRKCPYCGSRSTGNYYVDPYGSCWHTSVSCPSLKRTVNEMDLDDCGHMHECKDCRKARGG